MTWKAKTYLIAVYIAGLWVTAVASGQIERSALLTILVWVIIATPFEIRPIQVASDLHYTLSFAIHLALLMIYGYWVAIIVAALVTAITDLYGKKGITKLLFNVSQFAISIFLAGVVFDHFKTSFGIFMLPQDLPAFVFAAVIYISTNLLLVSFIIALTQKRNVFYVLKSDFRMILLYYTALAPISMLMVLLYKQQPLTIILIIPPLVIADSSFRSYVSQKLETRMTLEILADFVDRRDRYTAEHSSRVTGYASAIAEEMGIDEADKELIELAGMVHDLGKIAVSDSILLKPGQLDQREMGVMKSHPEVAFKILKPLQMYKLGSVIVKEHHECYDGSGYPLGLKKEGIHIGARIIAVADSYDAMTSDRPYRKAMTREEAIRELKKYSGSQFDPGVVEAFLRVLGRSKNRLEVG